MTYAMISGVQKIKLAGAEKRAFARWARAYADAAEAAKEIVRTVGTVEPEPELVSRYAERYAVWKELYPRLKELFPRMAAEG